MDMLLFFPLAWMICSDFRERMVGVFPLLGFAGILLVIEGMEHGWRWCLYNMSLNSLLLLFLGIGILVYFILRYPERQGLLKNHIGYGDIVFLFCLTPAFELKEMICFLIVSLTLSLLVYPWLVSWKERGIPLVSMLGICFLCYRFYGLF